MAKYTLIQSFKFAFKGISLAFKERNFILHIISMTIVVFLGYFFGVSKIEWIVLLLCIGAVLSLELMNTALEKLTDLISPEIHPLAGAAKDIAAASVLIFSIIAAIIGLIIFIPYFVNYL